MKNLFNLSVVFRNLQCQHIIVVTGLPPLSPSPFQKKILLAPTHSSIYYSLTSPLYVFTQLHCLDFIIKSGNYQYKAVAFNIDIVTLSTLLG